MTYWPAEVAHRAPVNDFPPTWASAWGDDRYGLWADLVVSGVTQRMRWIEPTMGNGFWMGSPQAERDAIQDKEIRKWANQSESLPQLVKIASGFWLSDTPCTKALWTAVTGQTPHHFNDGADAALYPAVGISYQDAHDFLNKLKSDIPSVGVATLPTEKQWEYACRADTRTAYWWGDTFDHTMANAKKSGAPTKDNMETMTPVKHYPPNPWGLYDMHGNVGEWCKSELSIKPGPSSATSPMRMSGEAALRSGAAGFHPARARAAFRVERPLNFGGTSQGFRFILSSANT